MVLQHHSARIHTGTSAERPAIGIPGTPIGTQFYETDTGKIYLWDGAAWVPFNGGDADTLDTYHASAFPRKLENAVIDGTWQFTASAIRGDGATNLGGTSTSYKMGHLYQAATKEIYPDADGRGLFARAVNRVGISAYDWHFRQDAIPTGYAWQGAPFGGTPGAGSLYYNINNDYIWVMPSGGVKWFLSKAITNAGASWQNKGFFARVRAGDLTECGIRIDDSSDNNYAEIFMTGVLSNGTQRLDFRYRTGGGAVTTVTSAVIIPCDSFLD